jgi:hypothetical protein
MVLVLDDIGTKADEPPVPPSYVIETSAENYQWGYLIEPYDVSSPAGQAYYDSCLYSLGEAGLSDPGMRSASRLARLPGSLHRTGFVAKIWDWHPSRVWDLVELMALMDIPLKEPRKVRALKPGKHVTLDTVDDPVYLWLAAQGLVLGHNDSWIHIECPWRASHTDGAQGSSSTAYSPMDYGREGVGFKCLHGHCVNNDAADFMTWYAQERNNVNYK